MIVLLAVLLLLGAPIGIAFSLAILLEADDWFINLDYVAQTTLDTLLNYPLLAIPLFILSGELMNRGGLTRRLIRISRRIFGWSSAPLGHIMIGSSALMGAITGSSVATVAAIGRAMGPDMLEAGYRPGYVGALNASAGLLGVLLPPSIPLILYGSAVGVSITQLFLATLVPGFVFIVVFMSVHALRSATVITDGREAAADHQSHTGISLAGAASSLPALLMPLLVLGGIYSGIFTPTEAASVAAIYAFVYLLLGRVARFADALTGFTQAAASAAAIMFVIGFTAIFNQALTLEQIPQQIAAYALSLTDSTLLFLLLVNLTLLLVGMFMETSAATLLLGPLLAPAAAEYGIDPVHFGIIVVVNIEIGLLTPPLAANLYVAALTNRLPLMPLLKEVLWFLAAGLICLLLTTYIPQLSLWYRYLT
ncbi:TRAP transporter large permease [Salinisphaera orenii]|uniref:TRAP transporter large permease protein n=1 Tax=Salinisphaera orenii YIM 95161 TaxID=1051139 RepID=A0A423Q2Z2_9GAMM|nr:TRAP transporter large permease [Salinisphaera halophila]ROO33027.1 membrane protein [Salinisphaera halophila YIM 95161]